MCTSGTAVANLHPALLEAVHAGVPMVAVTADRPERLRGTSANQTTEQVGVFGWLVPVVDVADGGLPPVVGDGPLHLNVQLDEPLVPTDRWRPEPVERAERDRSRPERELLALGPRTVVVAGDDAGSPARVLAEGAGWPLLAEPSSGSRNGANALRCYRLLLDAASLAAQVERVVVAGHPTLSRPVMRLLSRDDVEVVDMNAGGLPRPFAVDSTAVEPRTDGADDPAWLAAWLEADASVSRQLDALLADEAGLTPYAVAGAVSRALPAGGLLMVGRIEPDPRPRPDGARRTRSVSVAR